MRRPMDRRLRLWLIADAALSVALFFAAGANAGNYGEDYLTPETARFRFAGSTLDLLILAVLRVVLLRLSPKIAEVMDSHGSPSGAETRQHLASGNGHAADKRAGHDEPLPIWARILVSLFSFLTLADVLAKTIIMSTNRWEDVPGSLSVVKGFLATSFIFAAVETFTALFYPGMLVGSEARSKGYSPVGGAAALEQGDAGDEAEDADKPKKARKVNLARLLSLIYEDRGLIFLAMISLLINSLSQLAMPWGFGLVISSITSDVDDKMSELTSAIVLLIIVFAIGGLFGFVRAYLFTLVGQRVVARLRKDVFKAIVRQEIAFFDNSRTGELTSRLSSDTAVVQAAITLNVSMLVRFSVQIIGASVLLFVLSWKLTLVMFASVPPVIVISVFYGRKLRTLQKKFQDMLAEATNVAEEVISNIRTVRSFSKEIAALDQYSVSIEKSYQEGAAISLMQGLFQGITGVVPQGAICLVLWYGASLAISGEMSVGDLTSFLLYTTTVAVAFGFLSSLFGDFAQAVGASIRLFELIDRKPTIPIVGGRRFKAEYTGRVDFEDVKFAYPTRQDTPVLQGVSFNVEPGSILALVGPSGSGKSTVMSLLMRYYDITPEGGSGRILLDGQDVRDLDPLHFRQEVGFVSQDVCLFSGTIRENIIYGVHNRLVSEDEIREAARNANADQFIMQFPEGYNAVVGERGVRLSGGQKQRIALARAFLMNPRLLLLDEATSALDAESEFLVQEAIDRLMKGRSIIIIAHRLSTVRNAKQVAVMSKGSIVEIGTHEELLAQNGVYKRLVYRQLQGMTGEHDDAAVGENDDRLRDALQQTTTDAPQSAKQD